MLSTRWEPFAEVNRLRREMDRLFDQWSDVRPSQFSRRTFPPLNQWESDEAIYVEAELPGLELDDLEILVTGGKQLSIKGERKPPELEGGKWHRRERGFGGFHRVIELSRDIDSDHVTAEFKHGVLTITLPKREEVKPRKIEVRSN